MRTQPIGTAGDWSPFSAASMVRFAALYCYDKVREAKLSLVPKKPRRTTARGVP